MQTIINDDTGQVFLYRNIINDTKSIYNDLLNSPFENAVVKMMGKTHYPRRKMCNYGDPGVTYEFAGSVHSCIPWKTNKGIQKVREQVVKLTSCDVWNYCVCNLYDDHTYSIGYHTDKEKDMDTRYPIISVSLGSTREFRIQPITKKFTEIGRKRPKLIKIDLQDGDFLWMGGNMQKFWKHGVMEGKEPCDPRINCTFRVIK